jgi:MATE family multidrug resistance protein
MVRSTSRQRLLERTALRRLFAVNRDIMIRTLALLLLFTWFANSGARLGAVPLAANHVLMQFISLAAFVLDAFAFTAESRIGQALGAGSREHFTRAVRLTGEFSALAGAMLAVLFWAGGEAVIAFITTDVAVRGEAARFLPFAALVPLVGMPSWLLDGIFIGATAGRALRIAAVVATVLYLALDAALRPLGNLGVWLAFTASYLFRAGALGWHWPALLRSIGPAGEVAPAKMRR